MASVMLLSASGAQNVVMMCAAMGYPVHLSDLAMGPVLIPFVKWTKIENVPMMHVVLAHGVEILLHVDSILGQCDVAAAKDGDDDGSSEGS